MWDVGWLWAVRRVRIIRIAVTITQSIKESYIDCVVPLSCHAIQRVQVFDPAISKHSNPQPPLVPS